MRLATRLSVTLIALVCLIVGLHAIWTTQSALGRIQADLEEDLRAEGRLLASTMAPVLREGAFFTAGRIIAEAQEELPGGARWWIPTPTAPDSFSGTPAQWQALVTDHRTFFERSDVALRYFLPVLVEGEPRAILMLQRSPERKLAEVHALLFDRALLAIVMIVVIALAVRLAVQRMVGAPLAELSALSAQISTGDFSGRVEIASRNEIGRFAAQMNTMAEGLQAAHAALEAEMHQRMAAMAELRHAERLKTVGQLASGTAHELGTPLNVVTGRARMIARGLVQGDDLVESAEIIVAQGKRMTELIRGLLRFARRQPSPDGVVDLRQVVAETEKLLGPLLHKRTVQVTSDLPDTPVTIRGDAGQIEQILANLLQNAAHAMREEGGTVHVELTATDRTRRFPSDPEHAPGFVRLSVTDTGTGIDPEVVSRIFEPFFTTKPVGQGTGLGLSIAYGIVRDHDGWIDVASTLDEGTAFTIWLPRLAPDAAAA